jgi:cyclopropane fatty-acyl-phospholipid synthase-like methyltransferase
METDDVQRLYTEKASLYHRVFVSGFNYGHALRAVLRRSVCPEPGQKVLDAGCGSGLLTQALYGAAQEREVDGVTFHAFDLTEAMLDRFRAWIREHNASGIKLRQANVLDLSVLPPEWDGYGLIVSSAMLEYVPLAELPTALGNLHARLKDGGTLILFITRKNLLMKYLIQKWWKANMYTRPQLENLLRGAGFTALRPMRFPFPHTLLNLWGHVIEARK